MEVAVNTLVSSVTPLIKTQQKIVDFPKRFQCPQIVYHGGLRKIPKGDKKWGWNKNFNLAPLRAVLAAIDVDDAIIVSTSSEGLKVTVDYHDGRETKIIVNVPGIKTNAIFDDVFSKMVAAAQPIPGFRRVKGGKTPDIPRDILLHILGPSKVNKQVIKKIINSAVGEYIEKEGLKVTKDLRVEESYEELEAKFEPGKEFKFTATIRLQTSGRK